jgi:hypothetical protein
MIMELSEGLGEGRQPTEQSGTHQLGLRAKRSAGKPAPIGALGHKADEELLGRFQIRDQHAFKLAASVGILGQVFELLQGQGQMPLADLLPERLRAAEEAVRQLLDLAGAEFFAAQRCHELVDGRRPV